MTPHDADALRLMVQTRSGVVINPANTYQIGSRLGPVARQHGAASVDELISALRLGRDERLIWAVVEAMVNTETWFFRDVEPFEVLGEMILPRLAQDRQQPLRIWSAACAGGQEAYSIAMTVAARQAALPVQAQIDLYASDLSESCIRKAEAGLYTQFEVQRGLPIRTLLRHFEKDGEMWKVRAELAQSVRWRRINLLSSLAPLGAMDVIFCRNTLNLFDRATRRRVLENLASVLADDGYLVLGTGEAADDVPGFYPSERLPGLYCRTPDRQAAAA